MVKTASELFRDPSISCKLITATLCSLSVMFFEMIPVADLIIYEMNYPEYIQPFYVGSGLYILVMCIFITIYIVDSTHELMELLYLGSGCLYDIIGGIAGIVLVLIPKEVPRKYTSPFIFLLLAGIVMGVDFCIHVRRYNTTQDTEE